MQEWGIASKMEDSCEVVGNAPAISTMLHWLYGFKAVEAIVLPHFVYRLGP